MFTPTTIFQITVLCLVLLVQFVMAFYFKRMFPLRGARKDEA